MGNTSSASSSQTTSKCNSCSQGGMYFSFGKKTEAKLYTLVKGKQRRVYLDSKGRYYKDGSSKKYLNKNARTFKLGPKSPKSPKGPKKTVKKPKSPQKGPQKGPKKNLPKGYYLKKTVKSPTRKTVKDKNKKKVGTRLSARAIFNEMGMSAVGKSFDILQKDGSYKSKFLRLRQNGSPYFSNNFGTFHLNLPYNKNWLKGKELCKMTGIKNSWPNVGYDIAPTGVAQPLRTSVLPTVPHMHFGKMCFGS